MRDYFEFSEALKAAVRTNCHHIVTVETVSLLTQFHKLRLPREADVLDHAPHALAVNF